jgi:dTDP-4-dehydrorhamnose 3,5-epimerase-like enzyme
VSALGIEDVVGLEHVVQAGATEPAPPVRRTEKIAGARIQEATIHADERGSLAEIYDERWEFTDDAVPFVYRVTLRPGQIRGWVVHLEQDDRLFFSTGTARVSLWDGRSDSPTAGMLQVEVFGVDAPALLRIPPGVYHAVRNVGDDRPARICTRIRTSTGCGSTTR